MRTFIPIMKLKGRGKLVHKFTPNFLSKCEAFSAKYRFGYIYMIIDAKPLSSFGVNVGTKFQAPRLKLIYTTAIIALG